MSSEDTNSHTNPEIGRSLERARAERGLSLRQVEEATKIRVRYLRDLERENFNVLPAVYVLGSLKTYADFLGLDGAVLSRQLKDRQAYLQQEEEPADQEPTSVERGGFLAALGGLPVVGDRDALEDDEDVAVPPTATGQSPRLYLGLGAVLILALAVALTTMLGRGDQPAVSQLRDPAITDPPARLAFSGNVEDPKDERNPDVDGENVRSGEQSESSDDKKEEEQTKNSDQGEDDAETEEAEDLAVNPPSPSTASASMAPASASATAAFSATSTPVATASSATTVPASGAPAAPDATAPQTANQGVAPRPAVDQPAPGAAEAPAGARRVVVADGAGPAERIVDRVRIVRLR